jgi:hypothetical protein
MPNIPSVSAMNNPFEIGDEAIMAGNAIAVPNAPMACDCGGWVKNQVAALRSGVVFLTLVSARSDKPPSQADWHDHC